MLKNKGNIYVYLNLNFFIFYKDIFLFFYCFKNISKSNWKYNNVINRYSKRTNQYTEIKQYINIEIYEYLINRIFDKEDKNNLLFYKNQ